MPPSAAPDVAASRARELSVRSWRSAATLAGRDLIQARLALRSSRKNRLTRGPYAPPWRTRIGSVSSIASTISSPIRRTTRKQRDRGEPEHRDRERPDVQGHRRLLGELGQDHGGADHAEGDDADAAEVALLRVGSALSPPLDGASAEGRASSRHRCKVASTRRRDWWMVAGLSPPRAPRPPRARPTGSRRRCCRATRWRSRCRPSGCARRAPAMHVRTG